ncbi:Malate dehydrogenase [uncultured archaeon]|nr:Malate dehydrogenase [uncultured archaeon]
MTKISIVGAGAVGAQAAFYSVLRKLGDIVLVDVVEGLAKGKALDLQQCASLLGVDCKIIGGSDYSLTKNSDIVMITAGLPRKPGMTREQLLETNAKIVKDVVENVVKHSPNAVLLVMTNPVDAMTYLALKVSKFPRERVIGQAGILDCARFRTFVAHELNVSVNDVSAVVLGSHGEEMVPVPRLTKVKGKPLTELLSKEKIDAVSSRVRNAGAEIVNLMQSSAFFTPGVAIAEMADAILNDREANHCCSVFLQGEYGVNGCMGVPVVLSSKGVKIVDLQLNAEEKALFAKAHSSLSKMHSEVDVFLSKL